MVAVLRAKRRLPRSAPLSVTKVSSALLSESARSMSAFACSLVQIMRRLRAQRPVFSTLTRREPRDRAPVADRVDLARLALAVVEGAAELVGAPAPEHVARFPEFRRVRLVGDVTQLGRDLSLLDFPEGLAAELEVVALVVDAVARVTLDVDPVVGGGDDVLLGDVLGAWLERDVRHALERNRGPVVGIAAAVRGLLADQVRLVAGRLVVDEDPVLDDVPARRLHPVVVIPARRQTAAPGSCRRRC